MAKVIDKPKNKIFEGGSLAPLPKKPGMKGKLVPLPKKPGMEGRLIPIPVRPGDWEKANRPLKELYSAKKIKPTGMASKLLRKLIKK